MSWVSSLHGPTKGQHEIVPKDLMDEAEKAARKALEGEEDDEAVVEDGRMEE